MPKIIKSILGGLKAAKSLKLKAESQPICLKGRMAKAMMPACNKAILILLLAFSFQLSAAVSYATHIVTNTAGVEWTDNVNNEYLAVYDTAQVCVFMQPNLFMYKDVRNISSGNTSSDVVSALRGDTVEFILTILNLGNTEAVSVVIADSIPAGTEYIRNSALETPSLDPIVPPDTLSFQHIAGGPYDSSDNGTVTAIKWQWNRMEDTNLYGKRVVKFRVIVLE